MTGPISTAPTPLAQPAARLGFWAAIATAALAAISFGFAVTTLPISGPNCLADCVSYPYADVRAYVPHDYVWMVPAMLMVMAFVVLMVSLQAAATRERRVHAQVALAFATISAALLLADYYIQFAVMQPSILQGESEGFALFTQYNPHGVFIALEDLGYFLMALSFVFSAAGFARGRGLERAIRWLLLVAGVAVIAAWFALYAIYGTQLEYRFEVASITIDWLALFVGGILIALWFRRSLRAPNPLSQ